MLQIVDQEESVAANKRQNRERVKGAGVKNEGGQKMYKRRRWLNSHTRTNRSGSYDKGNKKDNWIPISNVHRSSSGRLVVVV